LCDINGIILRLAETVTLSNLSGHFLGPIDVLLFNHVDLF
jgi:hypothetical protein